MEKATKVRITKCYLIEVCDKNGKELISDFCFGDYHESKTRAEKMKNDFNLKENTHNDNY